MSRSVLILVGMQLAILGACSRPADPEWQSLLAEARQYLVARQAFLEDEYQLGSYDQFEMSQESGEILFSSSGVVELRACFTFVGSFSQESGSWMWAWDNSTILEPLSANLAAVRQYGRDNQFSRLYQAEWEATEEDAQDMTAIAAFLLKAEGAYWVPPPPNTAFLLLHDLERIR